MNDQSKLYTALTSQVGRKLLTGITGVLLVIFVIAHLSGNLSLLQNSPEAFNRYAYFLHGFGFLMYAVEIGLGLVILLHAYLGIAIYLRKKKARGEGYQVYQSKGGPSKQSIASRTMIISGIVLLVFLVIHIIQFRFGPNIDSGFITTLDGEEARDLQRLVAETFQNESTGLLWVIFYVGVTIFLGFHLRHGVWSAIQSLGAMKPKWSPVIYTAAFVLGVLLAVGFLLLPIWIYINRNGGVS